MPEGVKKGTRNMFAASMVSAAAVYAFQITAGRVMGPGGYGSFSVFFSFVLIISSLLGSGLSMYAAKKIPEQRKGIRKTVLSVMRMDAVFLAAFAGLSLLLFNQITSVLGGGLPVFAYFLLSVLFISLVYVLEGIIQGLREFLYLGASKIIQSLGKVVIFLAVFFALSLADPYLAVLAASLITLVSVIFFIRKLGLPKGGTENHGRMLLFSLGVMAVTGCSMLMMNGGPVFIKILAAENAEMLAGIFMAALIITRVPVYLFQPLMLSLFPNMSKANSLNDRKSLSRYIRGSFLTVGGFSAAFIVFVYLVGSQLISFLYGSGFNIGAIDLFLLSVITSLYLLATVLKNILLALGHIRVVSAAWLASAAALVGFVLVMDFPAFFRVEFAMLLSLVLLFVVKGVFLWKILRA